MVTGTPQTASQGRTPIVISLGAAACSRLKAAAWGGLQARHVALAAMLGVAAGFVTGPNLVLFTVLGAFLVLNAHVRTFAVCWGLAAAAAAYLHDAAVRIGGVFVHQTPLGALLERCSDCALAALLGLHDPALCGGLTLAALFSLGAARTFYSTMKDLLRCVRHEADPGAIAVQDRSQPAESTGSSTAGESWHHALSAPQKALARFFWGSLEDAPARLYRQDGWLRPFGWVFAGLLACMLPYLPGWLGERELKTMWLPKLAEAMGMHGVGGEVEYSGWTGKLVVRDLAFASWPGQMPEVRVGRLEAHISPGRILRSQLHAMHVAINGLAIAQPADKAGTRVGLPSGALARTSGKASAFAAGERLDVTNLLAASPDVRQGIGRLKALLDALAALRTLHDPKHASGEPGRSPRFYVAKVTLESLPDAWQLGRHATISLGPISSSPQVLGRPACLNVTAPRHGLRLAGTLNLHEDAASHRIHFEVDEQPLVRLVDGKALGNRLNIRRGEASLHGVGRVQNQRLDLAVTVDLHGLDIEFAPNSKLAGLDANLCAELLAASSALSIPLRLTGPLHAPRWELSRAALAAQLADRSELAGRKDLKRRIKLALARRDRPTLPARKAAATAAVAARKAVVPAAAAPVEPAGEPQAIATDDYSQPALQPEPTPPAVQAVVRAYPRTSTPDEEDPPAMAAYASSASELTRGVQSVPYTRHRNLSVAGAWPDDEEDLPREHVEEGVQQPLPPEMPLPGPIGLNLGQDEDAPPLAQAGRPGLARRTEARTNRPVPRAAAASYLAPSKATERAATSASAPPEYMQGPEGAAPASGAGPKQPKSSFSRWARGLVNKIVGVPSAHSQAEGEDGSDRSRPATPPEAADYRLSADAETCPLEEPSAQQELPWYRRLWR